MKKTLALLLALTLCMTSFATACASDLGGTLIEITPDVGDSYLFPIENEEGHSTLDDTLYWMFLEYRRWMQEGTPLTAGIRKDGQPASEGNLHFPNLSDAAGAWSDREEEEVGMVPITLQGRQASAQFSPNAQNGIRFAAMTSAAASAFDWLIRTAKAAATGGAYPNKSLDLNVQVKSLSELTAAEQAAYDRYNPLGGARMQVSMAFGGGKANKVTGLNKGTVTVTTPVALPSGVSAADVIAVLVRPNGTTVQQGSVSVRGGKATFSATELGDYLLLRKDTPVTPVPAVPSTGDNTPLLVYTLLAALSGMGMVVLGLKKRKA